VRLSDVAAVVNVAAVRAAAAAASAVAAGSAAVAAAAADIAVAAATGVAAATEVADAAGIAAAAVAAAGCLLLLWYLAIAAATVLLPALDLDEAMLLMQRLHSVCLLWWSFCGRVTAEKQARNKRNLQLVGVIDKTKCKL